MRSVVVVSAVIPVIIELTACCGNYKAESEPETYDIVISEEEFLAALDEEGQLSTEGCDQLCREHPYNANDIIDSVESCEEVALSLTSTPPPETTPTEGTDGTGDTGSLVPERAVRCHVMSTSVCVGGRDHRCVEGRHEGYGPTDAAAWFGAQAHAESTSVAAFVAMGKELTRFRAPRSLVERCLASARDEVAHARILKVLAANHGGRPAPIALGPVPDRDLLSFAIENAIEGCVRETWAALVAHWQAVHAEDGAVRAAYARIARDEARHADLAWEIDAWLQTRLTEVQYREVCAARTETIAALRRELSDPSEMLQRCAGLPSVQQAFTLLDKLDGALWQQAA